MRIKDTGMALTLWASASDTYDWAHRSGAAWPCSTLSGSRFCATFDTNGLLDLSVNGGDAPEDIDGTELSAICSDLIGSRIDTEHPCYFVVVGQFQARDRKVTR